MTEENIDISGLNVPVMATKSSPRSKRDLFRFNGPTTYAINLEHVTSISLAEKKMIFNFQSNALSFELDNEDIAKTVFEQLLTIWSADVNE